MSARELDRQIVVRRLLLLDELVSDLRAAGEDLERLRTDRLARHGVERVLCQLVELASDINGHIATSVLRQAPGSYRESFELAVAAGVVPDALLTDLLPSVGLRNVLVHEYVDIDHERALAAVPQAVEIYHQYVVAVREWLTGSN